jgi:hypothetical protein
MNINAQVIREYGEALKTWEWLIIPTVKFLIVVIAILYFDLNFSETVVLWVQNILKGMVPSPANGRNSSS